MGNYELSLTKQAEENIEETLATLVTVAREIANSSEKDFEKVKSKKWYNRLWELVTFNKDNQKVQARGVSNLAKLNDITMKAIVLISKQSKDTANRVCECLNQISNLSDDVDCLFDQQNKIIETILKIKRGFEVEDRFDELSSNQRDIIFAVLRKYGAGGSNEYTQQLFTKMRLKSHETYDEIDYSIVEKELKTNSQSILFGLLHGYSLLLNDALADEEHEVFQYVCLSKNIMNRIKDHVQEDIKTYGKSGYVCLFDSGNADDECLIEDEDIQWDEEEYFDNCFIFML